MNLITLELYMFSWNYGEIQGFGAIIYIAAITSIDSEIYESATIDGQED